MTKIKNEIIESFRNENPAELELFYDQRLVQLTDGVNGLLNAIMDSIVNKKEENFEAIKADFIELIKFAQKLGASRFAIDMLEVEDDGR